MTSTIPKFLRHESATGVLLLVATLLALTFANSALSGAYNLLLTTPFEIRLGDWKLGKPLLLWINDGLMAVFFFLVGLELKRELLGGELSNFRKVTFPVFAAIGGMAVPAAIYAFINRGDPVALRGWAIPSATDIAFALGVLSMLGSRVPVALKVFLTTVAVIDDLGAIGIIAIFYTDRLAAGSLLFALVVLGGLLVLNRRGVVNRSGPYVVLGLLLWTAVLKSGVHATLAGVALAMFIPMRPGRDGESILHRMEHGLHPWVALGILPVFAFANAGVSLEGLSLGSLLQPLPLGIALGLLLGKQVGVTLFSYLAVKLRLADLPDGVNWGHVYGVSMLCGIGFTMSLFIGGLAFGNTGDPYYAINDRLGILTGSLLSGVSGWLFLRWRLRRETGMDRSDLA